MNKICKICKVNKPLDDYYKHPGSKDNHKNKCKICHNKQTIRWSNENKNRHEKLRQTWKENNKEKYKQIHGSWRKNNPQKVKQYQKTNYERNKEYYKILAIQKKKIIKLATPNWLTKEQKAEIIEIYKNRPQGCHVDHIIPLQGKTVSGLHVPWNLQYLEAKDNIRKKNKL